MLATSQDQQLSELLGSSIAEFDIPDHLYQDAVRRYEELGAWFSDHWANSATEGGVYPQGSFSLGTVVRPINPRDHYDIDLVCRRDLMPGAISQADLKADVGVGVRTYVNGQPTGTVVITEGKRCWTLDFATLPFHMDVLPAIPAGGNASNCILLTDREVRFWQRSNPIDFAAWFRARMQSEFVELRELLRKSMDVSDVPSWQVKTTLQRTVQALKRHRDRHFQHQPEQRPASIIITTLAAMAYRGGGSLFEVLLDVTARMPRLVERRDGMYWVPNPILAEENFAERWVTNPGRDEQFFSWIGKAHADFADIAADRGIDQILRKMAGAFGDESAEYAGKAFASWLRGAREAGVLGIVSNTATLGPATGSVVPRHTFHGGAAARPTRNGRP